MTTPDEILAANADYAASFGDKGQLSAPPQRQFAVLTCMDARLDPAAFAGLREGDAHVIRNAGGRADEGAIRSLVISTRLLATKEIFVIHHTDCGMLTFTDDEMRQRMRETLPDSPPLADSIAWMSFRNVEQSVIDDVHIIRSHPLIKKTIPIYGYLYGVDDGRLVEVCAATEIGKPLE